MPGMVFCPEIHKGQKILGQETALRQVPDAVEISQWCGRKDVGMSQACLHKTADSSGGEVGCPLG